jgi:membrane-bound lytic murein transglycosylase D
MFAGDWRLAVMAYNAGEYRVLGALKRGGQVARNATPEALPGLSPITHAYVRKLHALSCLLEQADDREEWLHALDRPVPRLQAIPVPEADADIAGWARRNGQDPARLQRLNPAYVGGRLSRVDGRPARLLAVDTSGDATPEATASGALDNGTRGTDAAAPAQPATSTVAAMGGVVSSPAPDVAGTREATNGESGPPPPAAGTPRRHTVVRGDSAWKIANRYDIRIADLRQRNGLEEASVLRPGKILLIDAEITAGDVPHSAAGTP